ncbi:uncharacterized protein FFFS_15798 [Fusarium fujikuroi]|nr:uncharacterized protein FFFS_15798 [Fusarium fujikuroi]
MSASQLMIQRAKHVLARHRFHAAHLATSIAPCVQACQKSLSSRFEAAIYAAVTEARAVPGKREFRLVVFSIRHFVLARVTPTVVSHSKRYALWTEPTTVDMSFLDPEHVEFPFRRPSILENSVNYDLPVDSDWVSDNFQRNFEELACFFISTRP